MARFVSFFFTIVVQDINEAGVVAMQLIWINPDNRAYRTVN